jgi:predicted dehydrogenase
MIRAGIIGCGHVAQYAYVPGIKLLGDRITVVATFDTIADRAEAVASVFPDATAYTTMDAFLAHGGGDEMDLVFNLTPAPLHLDISRRAFDAGYDVYTEKPIAASVEEARELTSIAEQKGKALICCPATLVTARFAWLRRLVAERELGRAVMVKAQIAGMGPAAWTEYIGDPRVFYQPGVGPMIDTGVYMLHGMTGLLGPARRVQAVGGIAIPEREITIPRFKGEVVEVGTPDILSINLDFGDETYGHLFSSFATPATKAPWFELYAERGTVSVSAADWYNGNGNSDIYRLDGEQAGWTNGVPTPDPIPTDDILASGILHAINHLENGEPLVLTPEHATHVLEIMTAALESAETGRTIELTTTFTAPAASGTVAEARA